MKYLILLGIAIGIVIGAYLQYTYGETWVKFTGAYASFQERQQKIDEAKFEKWLKEKYASPSPTQTNIP